MLLKIALLILYTGAPFIAVPSIFAEDAQVAPLRVCELQSAYRAYDGKVIRLIGRFSASAHAIVVSDQKCRTALLDGLTWHNAVCLVEPETMKTPRPDFHADWEPIVWAAEFFRRRTDENRPPEIELVVMGQLYAKSFYGGAATRDGIAWGTGFCNGNRFPFMLAVKRIEELTYRSRGE